VPPRLSTSRAYWNLRAEQVMDRVFSDGERTLEAVQVRVDPAPLNVETTAHTPPESRAMGWWHRRLRLLLFAVPTVTSVAISLWLARNWHTTQAALNRERDLQLIERVRNLPLTTAEPQPATATSATAATSGDPIQLPASLEPVMIPLPAGPLPSDQAPASESPVTTSPSVATAPRTDTAPRPAAAPEPLLVGVVHAGGGKGSAIFRLDQLSLSATPGELIGNSGWRLHSVQASGAVIERQGQQRNLTVGGAF
jgi:hypothetical protein